MDSTFRGTVYVSVIECSAETAHPTRKLITPHVIRLLS